MMFMTWLLHETIRTAPGSRERRALMRTAIGARGDTLAHRREADGYKGTDDLEADMLRGER